MAELRYRIMDSGGTKTGSNELKAVFETHLAEAGQMSFGCEKGNVSKRKVSVPLLNKIIPARDPRQCGGVGE